MTQSSVNALATSPVSPVNRNNSDDTYSSFRSHRNPIYLAAQSLRDEEPVYPSALPNEHERLTREIRVTKSPEYKPTKSGLAYRAPVVDSARHQPSFQLPRNPVSVAPTFRIDSQHRRVTNKFLNDVRANESSSSQKMAADRAARQLELQQVASTHRVSPPASPLPNRSTSPLLSSVPSGRTSPVSSAVEAAVESLVATATGNRRDAGQTWVSHAVNVERNAPQVQVQTRSEVQSRKHTHEHSHEHSQEHSHEHSHVDSEVRSRSSSSLTSSTEASAHTDADQVRKLLEEAVNTRRNFIRPRSPEPSLVSTASQSTDSLGFDAAAIRANTAVPSGSTHRSDLVAYTFSVSLSAKSYSSTDLHRRIKVDLATNQATRHLPEETRSVMAQNIFAAINADLYARLDNRSVPATQTHPYTHTVLFEPVDAKRESSHTTEATGRSSSQRASERSNRQSSRISEEEIKSAFSPYVSPLVKQVVTETYYFDKSIKTADHIYENVDLGGRKFGNWNHSVWN